MLVICENSKSVYTVFIVCLLYFNQCILFDKTLNVMKCTEGTTFKKTPQNASAKSSIINIIRVLNLVKQNVAAGVTLHSKFFLFVKRRIMYCVGDHAFWEINSS